MLHAQTIKVAFHFSHFVNVCFHLWTLVILVDLSHDQLRITSDN